MNLTHVGSELRRFGRGKLPPVALLVIILLPLLFGGLFVWSYWDPVGRIHKLPVAYVNSDEGAEGMNAGEQITQKLLASNRVTFTQVTAEQARAGVADGTYYFAVEIPSDFSAAVASVKGDNPHHATVHTTFNNDNGLIATTLGNQVVTVVLDTVNAKLGEKVTDNLLVGFTTIGDGLDKAADGAGRLSEGGDRALDGAKKVAAGTQRLQENLDTANHGAATLADGAAQLDAGTKRAANGADQLAAGLEQLDAATARLGEGAGQISGGVDQIGALADEVTRVQEQLLVPLVNVSTELKRTNIPVALDLARQVDGTIWQLRREGLGPAAEITTNLARLREGAAEISRQLSDPTAEYAGGVDRAARASQELAAGLHQLEDGTSRLVVGTNSLADGTSKLTAGAQQLTVGANALVDGLVELDEGSGELALKLTEATNKVPRFADAKRSRYAEVMSTPVNQEQQADTLSLFGEGLAPVFISLGLFMGSTVTWMLLRPVQRRAVDSGTAPVRVVLASYLPALAIGLSQATVMFLVQKLALGLHASHELGMWLAMCLTAATFQMMTLGINSALGATVGRVICICLMSLQIVSSGGLYPPETQPAFLRWFHTFDPMTYSVQIIRQMIFHIGTPGTTADHRLLTGVLALLAVLALFALLAVVGARKSRRWVLKDLHPEVAV
ncbi:membrane protein [Corynebacterium phocae]|uniref:Membrane protein n=1 Tax=Corynebacterium phocae TaxID=161895 RepID=A0A1L7D6S5_9CORY|nr:membrane protein [Corynebacterium phocae]KAA8725197.1 YhgE/Pip domain-containing protein [Corynebacterium phocae]